MISSRAFTLAFVALAPLVSAQSVVWTVGGAQPHFTDIQSAINAASDGDTLLVRSGTYGAFHMFGKALSIAADTNAAVVVEGMSEIETVPLGGTAVLVRLELRGLGNTLQNTSALFAHDCDGSLRIAGCTLLGGKGRNSSGTSSAGAEACRFSRCDDVAAIGCSFRGGDGGGSVGGRPGGDGLYARASLIALYDCTFAGGRGGDDVTNQAADGGTGGHGYDSPDSLMFASGSSFSGGTGGTGGEEQSLPFGGGCIHAGAGGNGGDGILLGRLPPTTASPRVDLQACSTERGAGGFGGQGHQCASGPSGAPGLKIHIANGSTTSSATAAREMTTVNPAREMTSVVLTFKGVVGDRVWLLQSLVPQQASNTPFEGRLLVRSTFLSSASMKGVIPASGQLNATLSVASLPLGVETSTLHLQMLAVDASGAGVLGSAVPLVLLDSTF